MYLKRLALLGAFSAFATQTAGECLEGNSVAVSTPTDKDCVAVQGLYAGTYIQSSSGDTCSSSTFCSSAGNHDTAANACSDKGMRLCTQKEYIDILSSNNPCDKRTLWTDTRCQTSGSRTYLAVNRNGNTLTIKCAKYTDSYNYLCCGTKLVDDECAQCPTDAVDYYDSSRDESFCDCKPGFSRAFDTNLGIKCTKSTSVSLTTCSADQYALYPSVQACSGFASKSTISGKTSCKVHVGDTSTECPDASREDYIDFAFAESYCAKKSARLCSVSELQLQDLNYTGTPMCNTEKAIVWSGEQCFTASQSEKSYFAVDMSSSERKRVCIQESSFDYSDSRLLGIRCCADSSVTQAVCASCPEGSTGAAKSSSFSSCTCPGEQIMKTGVCGPPVPPSPTCDADKYSSTSTRSCSTLSDYFKGIWTSNPSSTVCSTVMDIESTCFGKVNYTEAKATCKAQGARLCTEKEVMDKVLEQGGKTCQNPSVWTSTYCCEGFWGRDSCTNPAGHVILSSDGKVTSKKCASDSSEQNFACCADAVPDAQCTSCPASSVAPSGKNDLDDCVCEQGLYKSDDKCVPFSKTTCIRNNFAGSRFALSETGLKQSRNRKGRKLAATSRPGSLECADYVSKTYLEARAICEGNGMRLCANALEIKRGLLFKNDQCQIVSGQVQAWVARGCGDLKHWTSFNDPSSDQCVSDTETAAVVCCVDKVPNSCISCPAYSTSPVGSKYEDDCTCTAGYTFKSSSNSRRCRRK